MNNQINNTHSGARLRADSAKVLFNILELGQSASQALPETQLGHSDKDKAWIQEMVYGVLRQLPTLQLWLRGLLDKPLKKRQKVAEHLIILGFYQLAFSRVSTHAAVSETVAATRQLKCEGLKGLVNAVLRNFLRQELADKAIDDAQIASGLPKWLFKKLSDAYPQNFESLVANMHERPPIWLRVNQKYTSTSQYQAALKQDNIGANVSADHPQGLILEKSQDITRLPGYAEGWFAVQDGAAQLAATYLDAKPGERVLDCCAAPGGKTCHILESQPEIKEVVALDIDHSRLERVKENLQRLHLQATLVAGDACNPSQWWDGEQFDRILLDAPCSATGVIRRHPDIKWLRKAADIEALVQIQRQIIDTMWQLLKPGGTLLYATCSILPEENHQQIAAFLQRTADAKLDGIEQNHALEPLGRQILPGEQQMDGFYYARLLKS